VIRSTPRKPEQPILWIIAGPNGSGKSSFYNRTDIEGWGGSVWIVNPDLLTARLVERARLDGDDANRVALDRMMAWLDASIDVHQTIGVETVLSSDKYRALVLKARQRGFRVRMIYIVLRDAALQIERVRLRIADGGHAVPEDKIIARRARSFRQLAWFLRHVDQCFVFDNSTGEPDELAEWYQDRLTCWERLPQDMEAILLDEGIALQIADGDDYHSL